MRSLMGITWRVLIIGTVLYSCTLVPRCHSGVEMRDRIDDR